MTAISPLIAAINESTQWIRSRSKHQPTVGLILGSGLGQLADLIQEAQSFSYQDIPHFHSTSILGHNGRLILGKMGSTTVVCLQGRCHAYEGYPMSTVVHPTRVLGALGAKVLVQTNAAGGINTRFRPGDLMLIEDHLNLTGQNPLVGPNLDSLGVRFPDLSEAYPRALRSVLIETAAQEKITLNTGVYAGLLGPAYETPAEVRMLRSLGADAVGMSTVPETIAATHMGMRVVALSCISNLAAGMTTQTLTHQEVIDVTKEGTRKLARLIETALPRLV